MKKGNILFGWEYLVAGQPVKKLTTAFAGAGASVISATSDGKARRTAGISFKTLDLTFADSQAIELMVKQTGDVYQVKLNGQIVPLKNPDDHKAAIKELVAKMDAGRAKFQKKLTAVKVELPKGTKSTAAKQAVVLAERVQELDTQIAEAATKRDALKAELGVLDSVALDSAKPFKRGDKVKIKPEWQDEGDDKFDWIVVSNEENGRVDIRPSGTGLAIPPVNTVKTSMIEHFFDSVDASSLDSVFESVFDAAVKPDSSNDDEIKRIYQLAKTDWKQADQAIETYGGADKFVADVSASYVAYGIDIYRKKAPGKEFLGSAAYNLTEGYSKHVLGGVPLTKVWEVQNKMRIKPLVRAIYDTAWGKGTFAYLEFANSRKSLANKYPAAKLPPWVDEAAMDDATFDRVSYEQAKSFVFAHAVKQDGTKVELILLDGRISELTEKGAATADLEKPANRKDAMRVSKESGKYKSVTDGGAVIDGAHDYSDEEQAEMQAWFKGLPKDAQAKVMSGQIMIDKKAGYRASAPGGKLRITTLDSAELDPVFVNPLRSNELVLDGAKGGAAQHPVIVSGKYDGYLSYSVRTGKHTVVDNQDAAVGCADQDMLDRYVASFIDKEPDFKGCKFKLSTTVLDYAGQPRDTDGTFASGKQGSLKAKAQHVRFAVKRAFSNPFRK